MPLAAWLSAALAAAVRAGPLSEVEITADPVQKGQQIYTVRMRPAETRKYDKLVFECVYRQDLPWEMTNEARRIKIHEPASFTYPRKDVKMTEDLDCYISFRVPIGMELLQETWGKTLFDPCQPVRISRMRISGIVSNAPLWTVEVEADGLHKLGDSSASPPAEGKKPDKPSN